MLKKQYTFVTAQGQYGRARLGDMLQDLSHEMVYLLDDIKIIDADKSETKVTIWAEEDLHAQLK